MTSSISESAASNEAQIAGASRRSLASHRDKVILFRTVLARVIKSIPAELHAQLGQIASSYRRSVPQEAIHSIELAISIEKNAPPLVDARSSKWANRKLLPRYKAMLKSGAFSGGTDSSIALSEERDA